MSEIRYRHSANGILRPVRCYIPEEDARSHYRPYAIFDRYFPDELDFYGDKHTLKAVDGWEGQTTISYRDRPVIYL
jgi:hypothetical protein